MSYFYDLKPRHRSVLTSIASRYGSSRMPNSENPLTGPLQDAIEFAMQDGERLHIAIRNRMEHGSAYYRQAKGSKAERRLHNLRWKVWQPILKKIEPAVNPEQPWSRLCEDGDPWHPCSEALAIHMRDCVPPISFRGGFAVGEAHADTAEGETIYLCFRRIGDARYCRYASIRQAVLPMNLTV